MNSPNPSAAIYEAARKLGQQARRAMDVPNLSRALKMHVRRHRIDPQYFEMRLGFMQGFTDDHLVPDELHADGAPTT